MKIKHERSAGGIVFKREENGLLWLITQHSQHKGWGFPKGLIGDTDEEESMEDAALREVQEEGGVVARIVNPEPIPTAYKYKYDDTLVDKTVHYFLMEYISGDPADHDWEVSEARFTTCEDVLNTLTYQADKEAFRKILKLVV